jgi:purine-binding chemotaxis protein CheW
MENQTNNKKLKKYMCLESNGQRYALPLSDVKEVIGLTAITLVPNAPVYLKGLINLRGRIITTLDFATILNSKEHTKSKRPSVIICTTDELKKLEQHVGLVVDDVLEVVSIADETINYDIQNLQFSAKAGIIGAIDLKEKGLTLLVKLENTMAANGFNLVSTSA